MKINSIGGEARTAKGAVKALAGALKDVYVDGVGGTLVITVKRATIPAFGRQSAYEGFAATADLRTASEKAGPLCLNCNDRGCERCR